MGPQGLRAGWSVAIFLAILFGVARLINWLLTLTRVIPKGLTTPSTLTPATGIIAEGSSVLLILFAAWIVSKIERRRIMDYNLRGPGRTARFFSGIVVGFGALSVLVAALSWGGWLHFSGLALSGPQILSYGAAWGVAFLMVGCAEEGLVRCFLLFTLARGLNFWWGLGLAVAMCALFSLNSKASGLWGVYVVALFGLVACLLLHLNKSPSTGFWCAAWVTSVLFGGGHTSNPGENWVGIFSAAGIGFVFCASVKLTGSAWWAIGAHAAWDWGQSFFYGTPDSGMLAQGHLLNSTSTGTLLWTGGADGPEGSVLVIPTMVVILLALLVQYGRKRQVDAPALAAEASTS
jgi:membrane protease YdiL (CAAX protease family)